MRKKRKYWECIEKIVRARENQRMWGKTERKWKKTKRIRENERRKLWEWEKMREKREMRESEKMYDKKREI